MLLLIVDEPNSFRKKEKYSQCLDVDGVLHANSLREAEEIIAEKNNVDLLLIKNILIENIQYEINELNKLHYSFNGDIILKVNDENVGLSLLKKGVITEYYLSNDDENVEFSNLQNALRVASLRRNISMSFRKITKNFEKAFNFKG